MSDIPEQAAAGEETSRLRVRKAAVRAEALGRRSALPAAAHRQAAAALVAAIDDLALRPGVTIAGFHPIRGEIDPRPMMMALADRGFRLALPALVDDETMVFRRWQPGDALVPGRFGLSEPPDHADIAVPDVILVPLAAFDRHGNRVGYGKGFYDRALARLDQADPPGPRAIGLAFSVQAVEAVPAEAHDRPLDAVLTEAGLLRPGDALPGARI
ncbi:5-formyltetrahydrofolate cyclo-ligase [Pseudoxanthobacter sp.]|uniref:5-formyltetrahydrofolate cyclo-ligase n=1 Tax=Pseudoxanthobacter sp. TaxID=1925742 RepID=UPI002FE04EBD